MTATILGDQHAMEPLRKGSRTTTTTTTTTPISMDATYRACVQADQCKSAAMGQTAKKNGGWIYRKVRGRHSTFRSHSRIRRHHDLHSAVVTLCHDGLSRGLLPIDKSGISSTGLKMYIDGIVNLFYLSPPFVSDDGSKKKSLRAKPAGLVYWTIGRVWVLV
jgi:hypothetical protein